MVYIKLRLFTSALSTVNVRHSNKFYNWILRISFLKKSTYPKLDRKHRIFDQFHTRINTRFYGFLFIEKFYFIKSVDSEDRSGNVDEQYVCVDLFCTSYLLRLPKNRFRHAPTRERVVCSTGKISIIRRLLLYVIRCHNTTVYYFNIILYTRVFII